MGPFLLFGISFDKCECITDAGSLVVGAGTGLFKSDAGIRSCGSGIPVAYTGGFLCSKY